jgi:hypothetical protein
LNSERLREIARILNTKEDVANLMKHLDQIVTGDAFRNSRRSAQFLQYVVEKSIQQEEDALKERMIGIELFGRSPAYDTGEDAIVRVTASDVRRRLLKHYGQFGSDSEFRISLPAGGYIPEVYREAIPVESEPPAEAIETSERGALQAISNEPAEAEIEKTLQEDKRVWPKKTIWSAIASVAVLLAIFGLWGAGIRDNAAASPHVFPWSIILDPKHVTRLIASDPDLAEIQTLTGSQISISDYANQQYGCDKLAADQQRLCEILRGDKVAEIDAEIIAKISALAERNRVTLLVRSARGIRLMDLRTKDSYIFLGSARSNPWTDLFSDQVDFQIAYDPSQAQEIVRNLHPRSGEQTRYIPTAKGFGTGESFATISFLSNPNQSGRVLILEGTTAEGTKAAGDLAMNMPLFSSILRGCNGVLHSEGSFQVLLRVKTMAGAATETETIACHEIKS